MAVHEHPAEQQRAADESRGDLVRVGPVGHSYWLAEDSFRAFAHGTPGDASAVSDRIGSNETLATAFGDDQTGWRCREVLVSALRTTGRLDDSVAVAEALLEHHASTGDAARRLQVLGQLITARFARGEFERALDELTEALVGLSYLKHTDSDSAAAFVTVANAASSAEMFELASAQLRRAMMLTPSTSGEFLDRMVDGYTARNETRWAMRLEMIGRHEEAAARYHEAMRAALRVQRTNSFGHWRRVGKVYEGFAWVALGEPELGRATMWDAFERDEPPADAEDALVLRLGLARACTDIGETVEARRQLHLTAGLQDTTFSRQWQVAVMLQAATIERADLGDHPGIELAKHSAVLLATSLWEERERRLESVMVRMQMLDLAEENERVGQEATEDPLTGLGNRRKLDTALRELTTDLSAQACVLFIDLDRFKHINDTFSHAVGDDVLKSVAMILQRESRERDVVARYGGDEFVIILRGAPLRTGAHVAERIRKAVAAHPWNHIAPDLPVRVSVGVAEHRSGMTCDQLMAAADAAVYDAKEGGRDRVAVA